MFSVSGPGWSAPTQATQRLRPNQPKAGDSIVEGEPPRPSAPKSGSLIHPGTASEFRRPLEGILGQLPRALLQGFVDQGYCLHVIDTTGLHALTLEVRDFDVESLQTQALTLAHQFGSGCLEENPWAEPSSLDDGGASSDEELAEWLYYVELLNANLDFGSASDTPLLLPRYRYWYGRRLPAECVHFLRNPGSFVGQDGNVAGMVTHGALPGIVQGELRILFWDVPFRQQDPLLDWYVLHEMGHTTDYSFAFRFPEAWRDWLGRLEQAYSQARQRNSWITRYASHDVHEYLAEGFACWASPARAGALPAGSGDLAQQRWRCHRALLEEVDPDLGALIEEAGGVFL